MDIHTKFEINEQAYVVTTHTEFTKGQFQDVFHAVPVKISGIHTFTENEITSIEYVTTYGLFSEDKVFNNISDAEQKATQLNDKLF